MTSYLLDLIQSEIRAWRPGPTLSRGSIKTHLLDLIQQK